jgi:hypothetical protein
MIEETSPRVSETRKRHVTYRVERWSERAEQWGNWGDYATPEIAASHARKVADAPSRIVKITTSTRVTREVL